MSDIASGVVGGRRVALVSIDGVAPRFVTPERMPNLCALVRSGGGCFTARTVEPPWTRPAHASMLRGVDPTAHGLVDNSMAAIAPVGSSVLEVARTAGRTTACLTSWKQCDTLVEPGAATHRYALDAGYDPSDDDVLVEVLGSLVGHARPDVVFVYLVRPDLAGHEFGWGSAEYLRALESADVTLGRLLAALDVDRVAADDAAYDVVVTTDHGGLDRNHGDVVDDVMTTFVAVRSPRVAAGSKWAEASILDIAPTVADLAGVDLDPRWVGQSLIGRERSMLDHLVALVRESGRHTYGERVTMLDHALQTAANAVADGADDDLVLAALLHDVGHLIGSAGSHGDPDHAEVGAQYLRPWLSARITEPIRLHVAAKRWLVASDDTYRSLLSDASLVTLEQQGGAFDAEEMADFESEPHAMRAAQLRRYDDEGKRHDVEPAPLESYVDRIAAALAHGSPARGGVA